MWKKFLAASAVASGIIGLLGGGSAFAVTELHPNYVSGQNISMYSGSVDVCVRKTGGYSGDSIIADIRGANYEKQIVFGNFADDSSCVLVEDLPIDAELKYVTSMGINNLMYMETIEDDHQTLGLFLDDATTVNKYLRSYGQSTTRTGKSATTINFDANGGSGTVPVITGATVGSNVTLPKSTLTRTGYNFAGWNTKADGSGTPYADEATITVGEPGQIQLFAQWVATTTLDTGQSVNAAIKTLAAGSSVSYVSNDTLIKKLEFVDTLPAAVNDNTPKVNIALSGEEPVYAYWVANEEEIYINTEADIIYANSDSSDMFYNMRALTSLNLPMSFNTANVTSMIGMFSTMTALTLLTLPTSFNTANVTDMGYMFSYMTALTSLNLPTSFNTANVTNMDSMFSYMTALTSLTLPTSFNTANVTNMSGMFNGTEAFTSLTLPTSFNTANVTNMNGMFAGMRALASLTLPDTFVINSSTTTTGIFASVKDTAKLCATDATIRSLWPGIYCGTTKLQSGQNVNVAIKQLAGDGGARFSDENTSIETIRFVDELPSGINPNTAAKVNIGLDGLMPVYAYWNGDGNVYIDSEAETIYANENSSSMFQNFTRLTAIDFSDIFNTSKTTNMWLFFFGDAALTSLTLPSSFDTSKVTTMQQMFQNVSSLTTLKLPTSFNTSNVRNMNFMFAGMSRLTTLTFSNSFNTKNVENMAQMFQGMTSLTALNLPESFNTSNVTTMQQMFLRCEALTSLTLPAAFDTSKVSDMQQMFLLTSSLTKLTLLDAFVVKSGANTNGIFATTSSTVVLYATDSTIRSLWPGVLGN